MLTLKQIVRGMMNCYPKREIGGVADYSNFRPNTVTPFYAGIDEGYFAEGVDGVGYLFICGTNSFADWVSDFDAAYNCNDKNVKVHRGFKRSFVTIKNYCDLLKGYRTKCVAGHSRGGALATLAARHTLWHAQHDWNEPDTTVYCITAGSPMVYNPAGAAEFDSTDIISIRMKYKSDMVTYVPPECFGYKHVKGLLQLGGDPFIPWPIDHYPINYYNAL